MAIPEECRKVSRDLSAQESQVWFESLPAPIRARTLYARAVCEATAAFLEAETPERVAERCRGEAGNVESRESAEAMARQHSVAGIGVQVVAGAVECGKQVLEDECGEMRAIGEALHAARPSGFASLDRFHVHCGQAMPHREVNRFPRMLVQFPQVGQT